MFSKTYRNKHGISSTAFSLKSTHCLLRSHKDSVILLTSTKKPRAANPSESATPAVVFLSKDDLMFTMCSCRWSEAHRQGKKSAPTIVGCLVICMKSASVPHLHGRANTVHRVLRARNAAAISPVQVELQAVIDFGQISSWHLDSRVKLDLHWKSVRQMGRMLKGQHLLMQVLLFLRQRLFVLIIILWHLLISTFVINIHVANV